MTHNNRREILFFHPMVGTRSANNIPLAVMVRLGMIQAAKPDWMVRAEAELFDAQDERATLDAAFGPEVQ